MYAAKFSSVSRQMGLAALVLLAPCVAHAQSRDDSNDIRLAAAAPQSIALKFDWGAALDANVVTVREEFATRGDSQRVAKLEARFHLHAAREGNRYVLTFSNLTMSFDGQPVQEGALPGMLGPLTGLVLNYDIAGNGDFIGLRDLQGLQKFTEQSYLAQNGRLRQEDRPSTRDSNRAMNTGSSPEVLQLEASRTWGALAGIWTGLTLTEGQPIVSNSAVTVPVINSPLTLRTTFQFVGREACAKGERKRSCVRLRATSHPDAAQLAAALERLQQRSGEIGPVTGGLNIEEKIELITDPDTLRPRQAEWIRGTDVSDVEDGRSRVQDRQSTRTTMTFDYSAKR